MLKSASNIREVIFLLSFLLVPEGCAVVWELDSILLPFVINGLLIALYMFLCGKFRYIYDVTKNNSIYIVLIVIAVHSIFSILFDEIIDVKTDLVRLILSWLMLPLILSYSALLVSFNSSDRGLTCKVNQIINIFIIGGLMGVLGFTFFGAYAERKPIMTFSEISHYAIFVAPFLWYLIISGEVLKKRKIQVILAFLLISILYQSVALVLVILIGAIFFAYLEFRKFKMTILFSMIIGLLAIIGNVNNADYYISRLSPSVSEESTNLSYLAGIEEAYIAINKTYGLGLGFQQMGIEEPSGSIANFHYDMTGAYINRYDGSAAWIKIVAEFGLLGIAVVLYIVNIMARSLFGILATRRSNFKIYSSPSYIFANCLVCSFVMYMFVRGGGYHSIQFAYLIAGLILLAKFNRKDRRHEGVNWNEA